MKPQVSGLSVPSLPISVVGLVSMIDALHLVRIAELLCEVSRVRQKDGHFVAYTRTKEQNEASLLGRMFPPFADVETRLLPSRDFVHEPFLSAGPGVD
jgi:hypothetical protein